jgi:bifunctional DNA-binding transcriptional regulator/antitoxin component of YhaV-PrlF toxin-antitoxin module
METVLEIRESKARGLTYYRLLIPKKLSNLLRLQKGDAVQLKIEAVKRDGKIIYSAKEPMNAE